MTEKRRIPLVEAQALADELVELLSDVTERIQIAGSIRRRRPDVGDIEIVCIPRYEEHLSGLFGDQLERKDLLDIRVKDMLTDEYVSPRLDVNGRQALGTKYRRLIYKGFPLDLFSTTADQWAVILTIRTGPADFSHRLVTPRRQGGLLPDWAKVREGRIWTNDVTLTTTEEKDVLAFVGLPWIEPEHRTGSERATVPA